MNKSKLLRLPVTLVIMTAALLSGCASEKMLQASHKKKPTWVTELPRQQGDMLYFYGVGKAGEQNDAERMAHMAAATRISESLVVILRSVYDEKIKADPTKEEVYRDSISKSLTNNILEGMLLSDSYWELWQKDTEKYILFHGRIAVASNKYDQLKSDTRNRLVQEKSTIKEAEELFKQGKHQEVVNKLFPLTSSGMLVNEIYPLIYKSYAEMKEHQKALEVVDKGISFGIWHEQEAQFMRETQEVALIDQIEMKEINLGENIRNTEYLLRTCHSRSAFERAGQVYGRLKAKAFFEETLKNASADSKVLLAGFYSSDGEPISPGDTFAATLTKLFKQDARTAVMDPSILRKGMDRKGWKRINTERFQEIARQENLQGIYVIRKGNTYFVQATDSDNLVTAKPVLMPTSEDWDRRAANEDLFGAKALSFFGCNFCNNTGKCLICNGTGYKACPTCGGTRKIKRTITCTDCGGKGSFDDQQRCGACGGSGGPRRPCTTCGGSGSVPFLGLNISCSSCGGVGTTGCPKCGGAGVVPWSRPCQTCNNTGQKSWYDNCADCDTNGRVRCTDCGGKTTCKHCVK